MKSRIALLILSLSLAACQSSGKEDVSAALTPKAGAAAADKAFPVKTKEGLQFGGNRAVANQCMVPAEGKQGNKPLTQAVIDGWPQAFVSDIAILQAALAGVAYPEEVVYIQDCMQVKVTQPQTPGQMAEPAATTTRTAPATEIAPAPKA
ncbi:MAG: hypothetical protein WCC66_02035 [Rhizobiaceae bacterium]